MAKFKKERPSRRPSHPGEILKTNPKMWMNLQVQLDIWEAEERAA